MKTIFPEVDMGYATGKRADSTIEFYIALVTNIRLVYRGKFYLGKISRTVIQKEYKPEEVYKRFLIEVYKTLTLGKVDLRLTDELTGKKMWELDADQRTEKERITSKYIKA